MFAEDRKFRLSPGEPQLDVVIVWSLEGEVTKDKSVKHHSSSPDVSVYGVVLAPEEDVRTGILSGSREDRQFVSSDVGGSSKVDQLDGEVFRVDEDVLWFDVQVSNL